jgi:hypothetical protein
MVRKPPSVGSVIHCHIAGIVSTLARGGYSTCGAFDTKGPKFFTCLQFACLVLGSAGFAAPLGASAAVYQAVAASEVEDKTAATGTIAFDIPPQPLLTALRSYSEVTGQAVLVDDALTVGRQSPGVKGNYDEIGALRTLLAGTGLVASYSTNQSFTLKLAGSGQSIDTDRHERPDATASGGIEAVTERYAGKIQRPIETALCQSKGTRPGGYRLAMQMWIAPTGKVERIHLLTPLNDVRRGDEVRVALNHLVLDPPPPDMPQPITLLLLPGLQAAASLCDASPQG